MGTEEVVNPNERVRVIDTEGLDDSGAKSPLRVKESASSVVP